MFLLSLLTVNTHPRLKEGALPTLNMPIKSHSNNKQPLEEQLKNYFTTKLDKEENICL